MVKAIDTVDKNRRVCAGECSSSKRLNVDFYESNNPLASKDGRMFMCKVCTREYFNNDKESLDRLLRIVDKPFKNEVWELAYKHKNETFGTYLKLINNDQYGGSNQTYDDSESLYNDNQEKENEKHSVILDDEEFEITPAMRRRWLGHREDSDVRFLETYYQKMIDCYECDTPMQEQLYMNIATTQLEANKALLSGGQTGNYEKLMNTISKLMGDANVKPVQDSGGDAENLNNWGVWVKKIEETEPVPDPLPIFKDVDGIMKYIQKWFVDHFAKVFDIKRDDHNEAVEVDGE